MVPQADNEIIRALEQSAEEFLGAAGVDESLAHRRPGEGRWSVLECMEHVTRVEESFLERLKPVEGGALPLDQEKESWLAARMIDRSERRQAPEAARPTGRCATLEQAVDQFQAVRERLRQFAAEHASDLTLFTATSPRWGVLSGREVLLIIAGHSRRHAAQIRETLEAIRMNPQQRTDIVEILEQSRADFLAAAKIPESAAAKRPAEGRWSVLDCVEHVAFVEETFFGRLKAAEGDAPPLDPQKELALMARVSSREVRIQAPDAIHPKGKFASLAEAVEQFNDVRTRTARFAEEHAADLASFTASHPVLGLLNGREAMVILAAHSRRHAAQMREAAAAVVGR